MIGWSKSKQLSTRDYDKLRELFEEGLLLGAAEDIQGNLFTSPEASLVTSCLSLYQNLVLFELAYDDVGVALALLQHLVSVCPSVPQLWALYARYRIAGKFGGLAVYITTAKLKSAKISYSHIYVWRSRTEPPNLNLPIFLQ